MSINVNLGEHTEDSLLSELIQEGDKKAFTIIYDRYNKMLYTLAFRYLQNEVLAEDAVQHIFVKLWEHRSHILVSVSLKNYLYTMTKNYILNQIRSSNNVLIESYQAAQIKDLQEDSFLALIEEKEMVDTLYHALQKLPNQKRTICKLKMEEKMSNQDIADRMNISVNTVKTHYAEAKKILKLHIEKMLILFPYLILFYLISVN